MFILLVEDDNTLRKLLARMLGKAGYNVVQAATGAEAIERLQQTAGSPQAFDVVLTDIVMDGADGIAVTEFALKQPEAPEVIVLTGHGSLATAVASLRYGAFDYLLKPVVTSYLLERVAAASERRRTRLEREREAAGLRKVAEILAHVEERFPKREGGAAAPLGKPGSPRYRQVGPIHIDTYRHEITFNTERVHVTPTEYAIIMCLAETPGQVVPYEDIVRWTHRQNMLPDEAHALLTSHIRNIRRKLDQRCLVAVRSVGYMLVDPAAPELSSG